MSKLSIALSTPNLDTCSLEIENYTADTVSLKYETLNGNQPESYANCVKIWESSVIPWTAPPIKSELISQNSQSGTMVMGGFVITDNQYIIGYAVGDQVTDICATAKIAPGGLRVPAVSVNISVESITTSEMTVYYYTLPGYLPKTYNNWIGLWEGYASPFNAPRPLARQRVESNSNQGEVSIKNVVLSPGRLYTLVYFMGADDGRVWPRTITNAAAVLNLTTAPGSIY